MKRVSMILAAVLCAAAASGSALGQLGQMGQTGQGFPAKPVRIIVAFPAGGGTDIAARIVAQNLSEFWGRQAIVENRAGASGVIGTEAAAKAAPDGYTLFMGTLGNFSVNQHLYPKMSVDPVRDFAPITQVVDVHFALLANPALAANSVAELIALARAKPGALSYASSGPGGAPHLAAELFKRMAGVDIVHIPYKGSGPSVQDVVAGQVPITFDSLLQALPQIREHRLKALAVLGKTRAAQLPEVPTVDESGLAGYELTNWFGLAAPAATPKEIIARLHADVVRVLQTPEVRNKLGAMAATVVGNTPEEFGERIRGDSAKWSRVIKDANIKLE
jgi:tripartite-type tricarboxylate transporter receptor subunit TctC